MPNIIIIAYFEEKYNIPTDYCFVPTVLLLLFRGKLVTKEPMV